MSCKIDLHVHTGYSRDCSTTLDDVVSYAKKKGLNGIAITDHDTVEGALRLLRRKSIGLVTIPGIEVSTAQGHILGLNVTIPIPPGLDIGETIERIHDAGGIAVAAHPSATFKIGIGLSGQAASYGLDAVEVVNASLFPFSILTYFAKRFAADIGLPQTGGSDSHMAETIGLAYTIVKNSEPEVSIEDLVAAIKRGQIVPCGKPTPWILRLRKILQ